MPDLTPIGTILGCRHGDAFLAKKLAENGPSCIGFYCRDCRRWVTREKGGRGVWLRRDDPLVGGADLELLPIVETWLTFRRCEGPCGRTLPCEAHHIAPSSLFGDDADRWPLVYLCRDCHLTWHRRVTWYIPAFFALPDALRTLTRVTDLPGLKRTFRQIVDALTLNDAA